MNAIANPEIVAELKRIAELHSGILLPSDVVKAAAFNDSALHSRFEWDDTIAAHQYRLEQARRIIRITVETLKDSKKDVPFRVFVSLSADQQNGGGYRTLINVLRDPDKRQQLLLDALRDINIFEKKYQGLQELGSLFESMEQTKITIAPTVEARI